MDVPIVRLWKIIRRVRFYYQFLIFNVVLIVISLFLIVGYMEAAIDDVLTKEERQELYHYIINAPQFSESFYEVYDSIYAPSQQLSVWEHFYERTSFSQPHQGKQCIYSEILFEFSFSIYQHQNRLAPFIVALELEERFSTKQCINVLMNQTNFLMNSIGVEQAANTYFKKEPIDLSNKEVTILIKMTKNAAKYRKEAMDMASSG